MSASVPNALDVRPLQASRKCATVLATFDRLQVGESFIVVDDSDPTALRIRIEAERPGEGRWTYLKEGPYVWHVRVERLQESTSRS